MTDDERAQIRLQVLDMMRPHLGEKFVGALPELDRVVVWVLTGAVPDEDREP